MKLGGKKVDFMKVAKRSVGLGFGGIAAGMVSKVIPDSIDPVMKNLILAGVGQVMPQMLGSKKPDDFMQSIGDGMTATATFRLIEEKLPPEMKTQLGIDGTDPYVARSYYDDDEMPYDDYVAEYNDDVSKDIDQLDLVR